MVQRYAIALLGGFVVSYSLLFLMSGLLEQYDLPKEVPPPISFPDILRDPVQDEPPLIPRPIRPVHVEVPPPFVRHTHASNFNHGEKISYPVAPVTPQPQEVQLGGTGMVVPLMLAQPKYHPRLIARHVQGYVIVGFNVTSTGTVENAFVITSEPAGVFDQAALEAIAKSKFQPKMLDGQPVASSGFEYRYSFELEKP